MVWRFPILVVLLAACLGACSTTTETGRGPDYGPNPYRFPALAEVERETSEDENILQVYGTVELTFDHYEPFLWRHFGGNPRARSREDAMQKLEGDISRLPIPEELHETILNTVRTSEGVTRYLTPGDTLDASLSGGVLTEEVVINYNVTVVDTPGARAGLSQAIRKEVWEFEFEYNGQRYVLELILPEVCYNWSVNIRLVPPPPPPAPDCAVVSFNVEPRDIVLFAVQHRARALTSECWGVRMAGSQNWTVLPVRCDACPEGWSEYVDEGFPGRVHASGAQRIGRSGEFQMRVPHDMVRGFITFCITREFDGERSGSCALTVERSDWEDYPGDEFTKHFFIEDRFWNFSGNCPWLRVS